MGWFLSNSTENRGKRGESESAEEKERVEERKNIGNINIIITR